MYVCMYMYVCVSISLSIFMSIYVSWFPNWYIEMKRQASGRGTQICSYKCLIFAIKTATLLTTSVCLYKIH